MISGSWYFLKANKGKGEQGLKSHGIFGNSGEGISKAVRNNHRKSLGRSPDSSLDLSTWVFKSRKSQGIGSICSKFVGKAK